MTKGSSLEYDLDSLRLELEAERHCHAKDNAYLLARAEAAESRVERLKEAAQPIFMTLAMHADARDFSDKDAVYVKVGDIRALAIAHTVE